MCGRFAITLPPDAVSALFDALPDNDLPDVPNYNVCPTNQVQVVTSGGGGRQLRSMRWGLIPGWYKTPAGGPLLINARSETLAEKPAFRAAARERRCLIPASGFYEWVKDADDNRLPFYIHAADGAPIAFAGLWQHWGPEGERQSTCAIATCAANRTMAEVHHRMPVIVAPDDWALWLGEAGHGAARLMRPAPEPLLVFHRVDPRVNSNRARGAELIQPI